MDAVTGGNMFIDLMEMIITDRSKYACDTTYQKDLSCRACEVTPHKVTTVKESSSESHEFEDGKHTTKGVSSFVGHMFGYMHS